MFEKEAEEWADEMYPCDGQAQRYLLMGAEFGYNRVNEELEEKISVLLSCKNCPENKDGLICQKEYENKCLAQKIQFIKELQQENAELKARLNAINQLIPELKKENARLKGQVEMGYEIHNNNLEYSQHIEEQLTQAKEILRNCLRLWNDVMTEETVKALISEAEQFLEEV